MGGVSVPSMLRSRLASVEGSPVIDLTVVVSKILGRRSKTESVANFIDLPFCANGPGKVAAEVRLPVIAGFIIRPDTPVYQTQFGKKVDLVNNAVAYCGHIELIPFKIGATNTGRIFVTVRVTSLQIVAFNSLFEHPVSLGSYGEFPFWYQLCRISQSMCKCNTFLSVRVD